MKKVKWGVIGTAHIARGCTIPGMMQAENCEMFAIAGRTLEKAEQFKAEFGFAKAYGSYDELLADPEIEAVYVALPNELHKQWAIRAMEAGKNVLCEKPLAPTIADAEEMVTAARANNVLLMEAFADLHSPLLCAIRDEIASGAIGKPLYMESAFITSDYAIANIRMRRETFGGSVYDLGCYNTSLAQFLLGEEASKVQAIAEFGESGVDVLASGILTFPSGARAAFNSGMVLATGKGKRIDRLQIHGTEGSITTDAEFNQSGELEYAVTIGRETIVHSVTVPHNYRLEVEQFGRCIIDGETPHVSNDFSLSNSRTLTKVLECIGYMR